MVSRFYDAVYKSKVLDRVWVQFKDPDQPDLIHQGEFILYNWDSDFCPSRANEVILTLVEIEEIDELEGRLGIGYELITINIKQIVDYKNTGILPSIMKNLSKENVGLVEKMIKNIGLPGFSDIIPGFNDL